MPIPFLLLAATAVSAGTQISGGISAARTAKFNASQTEFAGRLEAFNIETERKLSMTEAAQRHNDRLELYRENLSSNIASFAAAGRDVGGSDRTVAAFLERQKEVAAGDTNRSDFMAYIQSQKMMAEAISAKAGGQQRAAAIRAEGKAAAISGVIGAFTTVAGGLHQYNMIRTPAATRSTTVRPRANPFVGA
jgi:outer membrane murein-binding lipoprotein Lpp